MRRWRYLAWFDVHRAGLWQMVCACAVVGAVTLVAALAALALMKGLR